MDPSKRSAVDLAAIVPRRRTSQGPLEASRAAPPSSPRRCEEMVDELDVPPLI